MSPRFWPAWLLSAGLVLLSALPVVGQDLRALNDDLGKALRGEPWQKAIEIAGRIVRLQPEDPTAHYNMACALALSGREEVAIMALRSAAELGFASLETLRHDRRRDLCRSTSVSAPRTAPIRAADRWRSAIETPASTSN